MDMDSKLMLVAMYMSQLENIEGNIRNAMHTVSVISILTGESIEDGGMVSEHMHDLSEASTLINNLDRDVQDLEVEIMEQEVDDEPAA